MSTTKVLIFELT